MTVAPAATAEARLRRFAADRDGLRLALDDCIRRFGPDWGEADRETWALASLDLASVNLGAAGLAAFWRVSPALARSSGMTGLGELAAATAEICRRAGTKAAVSFLEGSSRAVPLLADPAVGGGWYRGLVRLAQVTPEGVEPLMQQMPAILDGLRLRFEDFIGAGIKASGRSRDTRVAFFSLAHPLARALLEQGDAPGGFGSAAPMLRAFATALWGSPVNLRAAPAGHRHRRTSIAGGMVLVPETFRGVGGNDALPLFKAAVAHATAHLSLAATRFPLGSLKPLQVALVTLIEDARVERLAIARLPGLRQLWAPYHLAKPSSLATAPELLARLSRALFDPAYEDPSGFVAKGRRLFDAAIAADPGDAAASRRIGMTLGNDLGQMRVQFNARDYDVQPLYRDDGLGLWDFGEPPDQSAAAMEMVVEAARPEEGTPEERDRERHEDTAETPASGRARAAGTSDRGTAVARYPEWDRLSGVERPDWTTVREVSPRLGSPFDMEAALVREPRLRSRIAKLVRGARIGRAVRQKRQPDGHDLDLDAALDAAIALRSGQTPPMRVYRNTAQKVRDMSTALLLDVSESTRARVAGADATVLDLERLAVAVLSEAMARLGDPFALRAFASAGREEVRSIRIKDFGEPYDRSVKERLSGLQSGLSTRLGTALRHVGRELGERRSHRRLLVVLTDGEPSDIDVEDPLDLIEDARRSVRLLRSRGIDVYGVTLDPAGDGSGERIFGRANHIPIHRLSELPTRLARLYFRLIRH